MDSVRFAMHGCGFSGNFWDVKRVVKKVDSLHFCGWNPVLKATIETYRQAYSGLPRAVWVISTILLINRSGTMVLPYLALYLSDELALTEVNFGYLLSFYGIGAIAGAYLGGRLSRTAGAIRTQIVCLAFSAPLFVTLGLLRQFYSLALFLPLMALFVEAARPATTTATTELCPKHLHTKALALNRMAVNLGMAIGPVIGGAIYQYGFIYLVLINASFCSLAALLLMVYFGWQPTKVVAEPISPSQQKRGDSPWRDKIYLGLLLVNTLTGLIFFQVMGIFQVYLRDDFRWTEFNLGCLLSINTIVIVLAEMVLVDKLKNFNHLRVIGWGCLMVGLGFGIVAFGGGIAVAMTSVLLWTFGEMLTMPLSVAYASHRSTAKSRSSYLAAYSMSFSVCLVAAPLIGTRLYSIHHALPWYSSLVLGVVLLLACYRLAWAEKNEQQNESLEIENSQYPVASAGVDAAQQKTADPSANLSV